MYLKDSVMERGRDEVGGTEERLSPERLQLARVGPGSSQKPGFRPDLPQAGA